MTGFARAFHIWRLVQRKIDEFTVLPVFIKQAKSQSRGFEASLVVGDNLTMNADLTRLNQLSAPFARANTLRLQYAIQT